MSDYELTEVAQACEVLARPWPTYRVTLSEIVQAAVVAAIFVACLIMAGLIEGGY